MDQNTILIIIASIGCILSSISLIIGLYSTVKVLSMERSTHSVQFVPAEMMPEQKWATDEKVLEEQNKILKEENEEFYGI